MRITQDQLRKTLKATIRSAQDEPVVIVTFRSHKPAAVLVGLEMARTLGLLGVVTKEAVDVNE